MKITKEKSDFGTDVLIYDADKYLMICFGGTLDLYWSIHDKEISDSKEFFITKENYGVYKLFEKLFDDIDNINIYDEGDDNPLYIENEEEREEYIEEQRRQHEEDKKLYRLYNKSNYNELFDSENRIITWYSDETAHEVANILKIKKEKDRFVIEFKIQPHIEGFDEDFHSGYYIPIRFRNSGSTYNPFNIVFMKMYNDMVNIDDINDYGHQMHIDEYLYQTHKLLKK